MARWVVGTGRWIEDGFGRVSLLEEWMNGFEIVGHRDAGEARGVGYRVVGGGCGEVLMYSLLVCEDF